MSCLGSFSRNHLYLTIVPLTLYNNNITNPKFVFSFPSFYLLISAYKVLGSFVPLSRIPPCCLHLRFPQLCSASLKYIFFNFMSFSSSESGLVCLLWWSLFPCKWYEFIFLHGLEKILHCMHMCAFIHMHFWYISHFLDHLLVDTGLSPCFGSRQ